MYLPPRGLAEPSYESGFCAKPRQDLLPRGLVLVRTPEVLFLPFGLVKFAETEGGGDSARVGGGGAVLLVFVVPTHRDHGMIEVLTEQFDDFIQDFLLRGVHVGQRKPELPSEGKRIA